MNEKLKCGQVFPSGCVVYTGDLPLFIPPDDLSCEPSVDDVLEKYGVAMDGILESLDLRLLDAGCLGFTPDTVLWKELEQIQIDKICEHDTEILAITTELGSLDIANRTVQIDLSCLIPDAAPCVSGTDLYTLISVLNTFVNAICTLRNQVDTCCLGGGNNGTSGTTGFAGTSGTSGTTGGNGFDGLSTTSGTSGTSGVIS